MHTWKDILANNGENNNNVVELEEDFVLIETEEGKYNFIITFCKLLIFSFFSWMLLGILRLVLEINEELQFRMYKLLLQL